MVGQKHFTPSSSGAVVGSGMDKNQDPGSGINIPDPQHWRNVLPGRPSVRPRDDPWQPLGRPRPGSQDARRWTSVPAGAALRSRCPPAPSEHNVLVLISSSSQYWTGVLISVQTWGMWCMWRCKENVLQLPSYKDNKYGHENPATQVQGWRTWDIIIRQSVCTVRAGGYKEMSSILADQQRLLIKAQMRVEGGSSSSTQEPK